jgi:tRNA(Ile)-lysidine synthase
MLEAEALEPLRRGRNLLAFSGGVDSTALYHLLEEEGIPFDLAMVNYKTRAQSDEEEAYARTLAQKADRRLHIETVPMDAKESRFEERARRVRYDFFERLAREHGYENLVTAHQLDDLLEWGLMQLCRGCGVAELVGMAPVQRRKIYTLVRPLLFTPKERLLAYLKEREIPYFVDESNLSTRHTRNRFRQQAARFLMEECGEGIARSFRYLLADKRALLPDIDPLFDCEALTLWRRPASDAAAVRQIDRVLKEKGYLLSGAQKEEILRQGSAVVGGRWAVVMEPERIWAAPYVEATMPRAFRERCRRARIPEKVRPYLFVAGCLEALLSLEGFRSS